MKAFLKENVGGNVKLIGFEMMVVKIMEVYKAFGIIKVIEDFLHERKCSSDG